MPRAMVALASPGLSVADCRVPEDQLRAVFVVVQAFRHICRWLGNSPCKHSKGLLILPFGIHLVLGFFSFSKHADCIVGFATTARASSITLTVLNHLTLTIALQFDIPLTFLIDSDRTLCKLASLYCHEPPWSSIFATTCRQGFAVCMGVEPLKQSWFGWLEMDKSVFCG